MLSVHRDRMERKQLVASLSAKGATFFLHTNTERKRTEYCPYGTEQNINTRMLCKHIIYATTRSRITDQLVAAIQRSATSRTRRRPTSTRHVTIAVLYVFSCCDTGRWLMLLFYFMQTRCFFLSCFVLFVCSLNGLFKAKK